MWGRLKMRSNSIADEMGIDRSGLIQILLREWLETNAYLPVLSMDEDNDTDGSVDIAKPYHEGAGSLPAFGQHPFQNVVSSDEMMPRSSQGVNFQQGSKSRWHRGYEALGWFSRYLCSVGRRLSGGQTQRSFELEV
jgi:hypothetical protein